VQSYAERCGMPYVNERWLGGMLTNFQTISKRVGKMKEYQRMRDSGELEAMPKKEALLISRELEKLERNLGGIRNMERLPDAVFILDTKKEDIAVTEANKLGLPIVAVVDTNCDPDIISFVIPGNDDAIRSANLMARVVSDAVQEGRFIASRTRPQAAAPAERSAEEVAAHAAAQADARNQAAQAQREREARLAAQRDGADESTVSAEPVADAEVAAEGGLTPENAENILDDAAAAGEQAAEAADATAETTPQES
jgi:small subunit ribosomal protein S2